MKERIKRALGSDVAPLICVVAVLILYYHIMPKIDPEFEAPTQGVLAETWQGLRDSGQQSLDVSDLMKRHVPPNLLLDAQAAPRWVRDEVVGTGRSRVRNADFHCPSWGWIPQIVQCDLSIGRDPCLYRVRVVFESETERGPFTKVTATAKRCRAAD